MVNANIKNVEIIERLGTEIITCKRCKPNSICACKDIEYDLADGCIPRVFFLFPNDDSPLDLAVIGSNPGHARDEETRLYREIWEQKKNPLAIYKELIKHWRKFPTAERGNEYYRLYYENLQKFLEALERENILSPKGMLFSEVVFCQTERGVRRIPPDTVKHCTSQFWKKEMLDLISQCKHVLCLTMDEPLDTYEYVTNLPQSSQWKVIGLYNPSGQGGINFDKYFENGTENLKEQIRLDLKAWEAMQKPYKVRVKPNGTVPPPPKSLKDPRENV